MAKAVGSNGTLFTISQVNALTGVPGTTIRFWEKEFSKFLVPLRTAGNQRRYDSQAVQVIRQIKRMVNDEGYTLEGARRKLSNLKGRKVSSGNRPEARLDDLAESMSDILLKKLFGRVQGKEAS